MKCIKKYLRIAEKQGIRMNVDLDEIKVNVETNKTVYLISEEVQILDSLSGNISKNINITTSTSSTPSGIYNDVIKIEFNGTFIEIPIKLTLKSFVQISENQDFCLDFPEIIFTKIKDEARFVKINVKANYWVMNVAKEIDQDFIIPYVNGFGSFDLGEKLHKNFPRYKKELFSEASEIEFYRKITSNVKLEELDADYKVVFTDFRNGIKMFPGKKPTAFPLLSNQLHRKFNHQTQFIFSKITNEKMMISKQENLNETEIIFGDKTLNLYEFPRTFHPLHLQWENQNLAPEWFTFTGEYKISNEFSHIYARNVFKNQNEKYDTTKVKTLQLNTGFLLKNEKYLVEEIILSKLAFIKIEDKIYRCFDITTKMVLQDSKEETNQFDLEILIVEE